MTILLRAMEKSPGDRYASAEELREDLARFRRYEPIRARPVGPGGRLVRWARRKPALATMLGVLGVAAIVLVVLTTQVVRSTTMLRRQEVVERLVDATYALSAGDFDRALAGFERVIALRPEHLDARFGRAMTLLQLPEVADSADTALGDLASVARLSPGMASTHALRARLLQREGRLDEARRELSLGASIEPRMAIDHQILGDLQRDQGDCAAAVGHYDAAIRIEPQMAWALLQRGYCLKRLGRLEQARTDYEILSRVWPDHAISHNNLANVLAGLKLHEDAFASYERALEIDPGDVTIHANYGDVLLTAGRHDEAERQLREALRLEPDHSRARSDLGLLLVRRGRLAEAAAAFEEVIAREEAREGGADPDRLADVYINLCDLHLTGRDLEAAERACSRSLELSPGEPVPHYNMAMLRMLRGDRDGALNSLRRNVELGDRDHAYLLEDEVFRPLHGDARFRELVETMRAGRATAASTTSADSGNSSSGW
jgi:Flp pilus assembly protein TadD